MKLENIKSTAAITLATGNKLMDSTIGQGIMALLKDAGVWISILSSLATVIFIIVLLIKKGAAEATESGSSKSYNKSIGIAIACGIFALVVGIAFTVIGSYFGVTIQV